MYVSIHTVFLHMCSLLDTHSFFIYELLEAAVCQRPFGGLSVQFRPML